MTYHEKISSLKLFTIVLYLNQFVIYNFYDIGWGLLNVQCIVSAVRKSINWVPYYWKYMTQSEILSDESTAVKWKPCLHGPKGLQPSYSVFVMQILAE